MAVSYYSIYSWMTDDLKLTQVNLNVYAFLYSFCRNSSNGTCYASQNTIAKRTGYTRATICRALDKLKEDGLIGWISGKPKIVKIEVIDGKTKPKSANNTYFIIPDKLWKISGSNEIEIPNIAQHDETESDEKAGYVYQNETTLVSERDNPCIGERHIIKRNIKVNTDSYLENKYISNNTDSYQGREEQPDLAIPSDEIIEAYVQEHYPGSDPGPVVKHVRLFIEILKDDHQPIDDWKEYVHDFYTYGINQGDQINGRTL